MNNELLIGVILIIAGVALAVLAYFVITSSDRDDEEQADETEQPASEVPDEEPQDDADLPEAGEPPEPVEEPEPDATDEAAPQVITPVEEQQQDQEAAPEPLSSDEPVPAEKRPRIQVATLLRDEVSGDLIVQVGDREYTTAEDLQSSTDWTRLEYAASDLNAWINTPAPQPSPGTEAEGEVKGIESKPSSMIEQINSILQQSIEAGGHSDLAVRLIEGPGGMARVLIGVHSYEIGEVPDPEVRDLIRIAVAAWEATQ